MASSAPILGAHMSIAGGYYKAADAAGALEMDCVQIFTKNNNQWRAKNITDDEVARFSDAVTSHKLKHTIAHNSYLINLGSPDDELWKKSIDAMVVEILRATQLGIPYVVAHPGAYTTSSEEAGIKRIAKGLDEVHKQTKGATAQALLETTAGQGSNLGSKFEHIAEIIAKAKSPDLLGVCVDTCHLFAAGYPLGTPAEYKATMKALDTIIGADRVKAFHLNDSKAKFASHVDRHEHIGRGQMGIEPFRLLMNDKRFRKIPMYLETPKGEENGENLDAINLRTLRELVSG